MNEPSERLESERNSSSASYEELSQAFVDALARGRSGPWDAARVIVRVLAMAGKSRTHRATLVRGLAADGHCTAAYIRQLEKIGLAFPETSYLDVSFALVRACIAAAKRVNGSASEILEQALAQGHHVREVSRLGAAPQKTYRWAGTCGGCGAKITCTSSIKDPVRCPVCPEESLGYTR